MRTTLALLLAAPALALLAGCTFNFDVTSQRTALENQVMGSYKELDDDLILASSVRGGKGKAAQTGEPSPARQKAVDARQEQQFNQDDIDELKNEQLLGETAAGELALLPAGVAKAGGGGPKDVALARELVAEENRDRAVVWQRLIESNENLSAKDLPEVRRTYAKLQREQARPGQWVQDEDGHWRQTPPGSAIKE